MIRALGYYLFCSLKNRLVRRLRRLRQPRYFISALAGLAYLALVFRRQFLLSGRAPASLAALPEPGGVLESGLALLLLVLVLLPWIWPGRGTGLHFTEAEVQFLFSAPVSRKALLRFRIVKAQVGILLGVLISVLMFGRGRAFGHLPFLLIALWVVYSFLYLYRTGTSLIKTSLYEHGAAGLRRQLWVIAGLAAVALGVVVWARWYVPGIEWDPAQSPQGIFDWFQRVTGAGPAYYLLMPFRWMIRPAFARSWPEFLRDLGPALVLLGLAYVWAMRTDASFEEAALARAREVARRLEAKRSGARALRPLRRRRPLFPLAPQGPAHTAILWKNLISAGRFNPRRLLVVGIIIVVTMAASLAGQRHSGQFLAAALGATAAALAAFFTLAGPLMIRDDLRIDLLHVNLLKTYPLRGWSVVLGEVLAPAGLLAALEWALLLIAVPLMPARSQFFSTVADRAALGLAAAILLPFLTAIGLLVQNAAALIMPGWIHLGKQDARGVEAMGQRLIIMAGTMIALLIAAVPAVLGSLAILIPGYWAVGMASVPAAAAAAAAVLALEAGVVICYLGRLFERFDASRELDSV